MSRTASGLPVEMCRGASPELALAERLRGPCVRHFVVSRFVFKKFFEIENSNFERFLLVFL